MWGKIVSSVSNALDFNQATLSGCIDIVCVESEIEKNSRNEKVTKNDKSESNGKQQKQFVYKSTPFHVRFGKTKLLRSKEKIVNILVNGRHTNLCMKLGSAGEAYFVEKTYEDVEEELETSPLASPRNELTDLKYNETVENAVFSDDIHFKTESEFEKMFKSTHDLNKVKEQLEKEQDMENERRKKKKKKKKKLEETEGRRSKKNSKRSHYTDYVKKSFGKKRDTNDVQNKREEDEENSEWSWSWGRLPHLKNNDCNSDSCTVISSNKKKKREESMNKLYRKSESANEEGFGRDTEKSNDRKLEKHKKKIKKKKEEDKKNEFIIHKEFVRDISKTKIDEENLFEQNKHIDNNSYINNNNTNNNDLYKLNVIYKTDKGKIQKKNK